MKRLLFIVLTSLCATVSFSGSQKNVSQINFDDGTSMNTAPSGGGGGSSTLRTETDGAFVVNTTTINAVNPLSFSSVSGKGQLSLTNNLPAGSTSYLGSTAQYVSSITANGPLIASTVGTAGSTVTISMSSNLPGSSTSYIQNTLGPQANSVFSVSSGTVNGPFTSTGTIFALGGIKTATETISSLPAGVMQIIATSSNVVVSAVGLSSQTIGNYVGNVAVNAPLTGGSAGSSNAALTLGITNNLPSGSTSYLGATALYIASVTTNASLNETFTGTNGATVTLSVNVSSISLPNSGVTAGSYTNTNLTVDSHGLITTASNGLSGGGGTPGLPDTSVQLNEGGVFVGTITLTYNTTSNLLSIGATTQFTSVATTTWTSVSQVIFGTGAPVSVLDSLTSSSFTITSSSLSINGSTYTWNAGEGGSGQFLQNNAGVITSTPTGGFVKFFMDLDPVRSKLMSPGTTNFPDIDQSTNTSIQSAYWSFLSTQTLTFAKIFRPYQAGSLYADFYFTGSTVSTGNVGWGVFLSCNGTEFSKKSDTQLQNYTVDVTTTGPIPSTIGNYGMLEAGPLTLNSCIQGDEIIVLVTRTHSGSDARGDVRLFPSSIYEK